MSVLSVICLAGFRQAEMDDQEGPDVREDKLVRAERGSDNRDSGSNNSCQS